MMLIQAVAGSLAAASITVDANWGVTTSASPAISPNRTLTVPGGTRNIRFDVTTAPSGTLEYSKNAGAYATVTDEGTLSVSTSDTLRFRLTGGGDGAVIVVYDNVTSKQVGTCTLNTS
jgi:hypothetical protein